MIAEFICKTDALLNSLVWGPGMIILLIATGLLLTVMTGFIQMRHFGFMLRSTVLGLFGKKHKTSLNSVTPFQAVSTAMAATIGTGSIAGLATAIVCGGPGSVFWMWVSALLGMATKYSEIVLSVKFRIKSAEGKLAGGPMYYIRNGLGSKSLAFLFTVFSILACFGIGNTVQSNSIASALQGMTGLSPHVTGIVLTLICAAVIIGGVGRIARVNERLVPFMAFIYVTCSVAVLALRWDKIPRAFELIFSGAFDFKAATGGGVGYGMALAMRYGFSRGVFSNEAGLGSAPIAHGATDTREPVLQGMWGMFEVFFTTAVICTMTALVILTSGLYIDGNLLGAALSIEAFDSAIPGLGGICVTVSTVLFALSSILGWAYYGEVGIGYIFSQSRVWLMLYRLVYVGMVYVGAVGRLDLVWSIAETMNGFMAIPNLVALTGLCKTVRKETQKYFATCSK